ncbi:MAG TPA: carboxypeptidase-like regulatory domain-containing protein [Candidatus Aminicenantes bacterium]|nr:carboxypeptidase-like regulatory domain-containing protein [Candidatus Aminicenantes bacterium]
MNGCLEKAGLQPAIRGKIADLLDYPVARARVVLCGSKLGRRLSTLTGLEGTFLFNRIPPGVYTLEVNCTNFSKLVQRGIAVQEHAITGLDMRMDMQEDSRTLRLRSLSLQYVGGESPAGTDSGPEALQLLLREAVDGLRLERALFAPPGQGTVGRRLGVEFGLFQGLRNEIMSRLLERKIDLFPAERIGLALRAELQAPGCLVLPLTLPRMEVEGARYLEWRWQLMPQAAGSGAIRLVVDLAADFDGRLQLERRLFEIERAIAFQLPFLKRVRRLWG